MGTVHKLYLVDHSFLGDRLTNSSLCYRCAIGPLSVLSCLSVTLVYCWQMLGKGR